MDALETLIRDTLREHAAEAPSVVPPVREPSARRWLYAGLAAVLVAGLAVVVTVLRGGDHSASPIPAAPAVPAGYKPISYHGITLAVPHSLPVVESTCTQRPSDLVYATNLGGPVSTCVRDRPRPLHVASITLAPASASATRTGSSVTIDGNRGYRSVVTFQSVPPTYAGGLVLPVPGVRVEITSPSLRIVETVLGSVHVTPMNYLGCPDRVPSPSPDRGGLFLPGSPTSGALCSYAARLDDDGVRWLIFSARVQRVSGLVATINTRTAVPLANVSLTASPTAALTLRYADGTVYRVLLGWVDTSWLVVGSDRYVNDPTYADLGQFLDGLVR